jgi:general secretion pathway protein D
VKYGLGGGAATTSGLFTFAANLGGSMLAFNPGDLGINTGSYDSGIAFGAAIDFLAGEGAAQTLSEPTLLCVNNQESSIYVGKTEPVISSSAQGNQTTDIARNTYTREDIGLTLKIKPRLSSGDKVTLITTTKLEDVANSSVIGLPSTTKREILTTAIVNDGESVIIGGLIHNKDKSEEQGIPGLRHIPWVGQLFRWDSNAEEEINLVIILTPYIVRSNTDMPRLRKMLSRLDQIQDDYRSLLEKKLDERSQEIKSEVVKEEKKDEASEATDDLNKLLQGK